MSMWEDYDYDPSDFDDTTAHCSRCGTTNLHWEETSAGFRLYTPSGRQHVCPPARPSDFDDLTAQ